MVMWGLLCGWWLLAGSVVCDELKCLLFGDDFDRVHDVHVAHGVGRICRFARVKAHEAVQDGTFGVQNPVAVGVKVVLAVFLFTELPVQD